MKKIFFLIFICSQAYAQNQQLIDQVTLTSYQSKSYIYTQGVKLSAPFNINASQSGAFFIKPAGAVKITPSIPPNPDQNFVRSENIIVGGITNEDQITSLSSSQKNVAYQYFDGIGRSSQDVVQKGSPQQYDVVKPYDYDQYGRMKINYFSYASPADQSGSFKSNALSNQASFYTNAAKVPSDARPYTEYEYELSPLNRVSQVYSPGSLWKNQTLTKSSKSLTQVNANNEVRCWSLNSLTPSTNSWYPAGTLLVSTAIDEEGKTVKSYADLRGKTVMTNNNSLITYYVYDDIGLLYFILPPGFNNNFASTVSSISPTPTDLNVWAFQYKYDSRQRLSEEKGPGLNNDWIYYVYDQWDRIVAKQDGVQRGKSTKEWSFIKYDELNRPIITGIMQTTLPDHTSMINSVNGSRFESKDTSPLGYSLTATFPSTSISGISSIDPLILNYYDDYSFLSITNWSPRQFEFSIDRTNAAELALPISQAVKGLITATKVKLLGTTSTWLHSVHYYDNRYREIFNIKQEAIWAIPDGGASNANIADRIINVYNFSGWLTDTYRAHPHASLHERYVYDDVGRMKNIYHTYGVNPEVLLASYNYNEAGQLVESNLHSTDGGLNFLQSVDFRYNIRGWLSSINNSTLTADASNDDTNDLFGMNIIYNEQTLAINGTNTQPKYDGNISAVRWKTDNKKVTPKEKGYGYFYDQIGRIQNARYAANTGTSWSDEAGFYDVENLQYDFNGNIKTLKRYGKSGTARTVIDDLNYDYTTNGNQLTNVEEGQGNSFGYPNATTGINPELQYDQNGNLSSDLNTQTTSVTYNYLNLPEKITIDLPNTTNDYFIEYSYAATGYLVKKVVKQGTTVLKTIDYAHGLQYYDNQLAVVFTPVGRGTFNKDGVLEYEYFIKDHLTNTRVSFGMLHNTDVYKATMEIANDAQESQVQGFKNISSSRYQNSVYNHTVKTLDIQAPDRSAMLNGYQSGAIIGPAKMLQVKSGDRVKLETYARYDGTTSSNSIVTNLVAAVTGAYGLVNSGETQAAYQALSSNLPIYSTQVARGSNAPKAYLFYILFDNNYVFKQFGYSAVDQFGLLQYEKLALTVDIPSDGFMYTYVANESNISAVTAAYFDDFQIIHEKTTTSLRVTESTDYDPFGMILGGSSYCDISGTVNGYKYQGDYSEYESLTSWNRFEGRGNYDPRLGRWNSVDPARQFSGMSPYAGMANNGVFYTDPDGKWVIQAAFAIIGGISNVANHWDNIAQGGFVEGLEYFATGAVAGAVSTVNPLAAASILSLGNGTIDLINGRPIDPTTMATDFAYTYIGGKGAVATMAAQTEFKAFEAEMEAIWRTRVNLEATVLTQEEVIALEKVDKDVLTQISTKTPVAEITKDATSTVLQSEFKFTKEQIWKKFGEHYEDFGLEHSKEGMQKYLEMAQEIFNDPVITHTFPQGGAYAGETWLINGGRLLRLDPQGNFRSLYPLK